MDFLNSLTKEQRQKADKENAAKSIIRSISNNYKYIRITSTEKTIFLDGITNVSISTTAKPLSKIEISITGSALEFEKGAEIFKTSGAGNRGTLSKKFNPNDTDKITKFIAKTLAKERHYPQQYHDVKFAS